MHITHYNKPFNNTTIPTCKSLDNWVDSQPKGELRHRTKFVGRLFHALLGCDQAIVDKERRHVVYKVNGRTLQDKVRRRDHISFSNVEIGETVHVYFHNGPRRRRY